MYSTVQQCTMYNCVKQCLPNVWKMSGECLVNVWRMYIQPSECRLNVHSALWMCMELFECLLNVWRMSGECLANVWWLYWMSGECIFVPLNVVNVYGAIWMSVECPLNVWRMSVECLLNVFWPSECRLNVHLALWKCIELLCVENRIMPPTNVSGECLC